jgi:hypothetical protein
MFVLFATTIDNRRRRVKLERVGVALAGADASRSERVLATADQMRLLLADALLFLQVRFSYHNSRASLVTVVFAYRLTSFSPRLRSSKRRPQTHTTKARNANRALGVLAAHRQPSVPQAVVTRALALAYAGNVADAIALCEQHVASVRRNVVVNVLSHRQRIGARRDGGRTALDSGVRDDEARQARRLAARCRSRATSKSFVASLLLSRDVASDRDSNDYERLFRHQRHRHQVP